MSDIQVTLVVKDSNLLLNYYDQNPSIIVEKSVKGMLPKNKLGAALFRNSIRELRFKSHSHEAQKPTIINLNEVN